MVRVYRVPLKKKKNLFGSLSVNTTLIFVNVILFILFIILISTEALSIDAIALQPANIFSGQYVWTFLTSMFMHGNFFHLFVNMLSLFFIGSLVEKILGQKRYLGFYLIAGLIAGLFFVLFSLVFPSDFNAYAVGASGALFGLVGLLVLLTPNLPVYIMFIPIPVKMKYAAPGLLIVLWIISATTSLGIGNTAHLGGLVMGLIYGIYLRTKYPNKIKAIQKHFS
jgi:membrane associated rhomboid family serine protease